MRPSRRVLVLTVVAVAPVVPHRGGGAHRSASPEGEVRDSISGCSRRATLENARAEARTAQAPVHRRDHECARRTGRHHRRFPGCDQPERRGVANVPGIRAPLAGGTTAPASPRNVVSGDPGRERGGSSAWPTRPTPRSIATSTRHESDLAQHLFVSISLVRERFYDPRIKRAVGDTRDSLASTRSWILIVFGIVLAGGPRERDRDASAGRSAKSASSTNAKSIGDEPSDAPTWRPSSSGGWRWSRRRNRPTA